MPRYFIEVSYKGTAYSGFQSQRNANTIQAEIEKALALLQSDKILLTSSSRTDAGVHALQNYYHFDTVLPVSEWKGIKSEAQVAYKLNAILPGDIVVKRILVVKNDAHARFDAISREYKYFIYRYKDPFLNDRAFYFPYQIDIEKMNRAAAMVHEYNDFTSFSKRNTQVKTFICHIQKSIWEWDNDCIVYNVKADRFLRGMVRALTATMLKIGRGQMTLEEFGAIIKAKDCTRASFSVPPRGLFLIAVNYPPGYFL